MQYKLVGTRCFSQINLDKGHLYINSLWMWYRIPFEKQFHQTLHKALRMLWMPQEGTEQQFTMQTGLLIMHAWVRAWTRYFVYFALQILQVLTASQIKDCNSYTYWFMGGALSGCGYNKWMHHWCQPQKAVPAAIMDIYTALWEWRWSILLRLWFLLVWKLWSGHSATCTVNKSAKRCYSWQLLLV